MADSAYLVTGGAGFIGLNLVELLLNTAEHDVHVVDNFSFGSSESDLCKLYAKHNSSKKNQSSVVNFKPVFGKNIVFEKNKPLHVWNTGIETDSFRRILSNMAIHYDNVYILHLAANSSVDRSIADPVECFKNNIFGSLNVIESYAEVFKNIKSNREIKLLSVSTDEVYGDHGPFPTTWGQPLVPSSPYSASKAAVDLIANCYERTYGLDIKISRCCNNFGKYQHREKFLPTIISCIKENRAVPVYGAGNQWRQWVPVKVHNQRLLDLIHSEDKYTHIGGYSITNIDLLNTIEEIINKKIQKIHVEDRLGHDFKYELHDDRSIDYEQFKEYLGEYLKEEGL